jgi:potassium voltage-gated channel Eag-related subfamily H protein 7
MSFTTHGARTTERANSTALRADALKQFKDKWDDHQSTVSPSEAVLRATNLDRTKGSVVHADVGSITELFMSIERAKMWTLDPSSKAMKRWDAVMLLLLLFTATVTPYEVAFLETKLNNLFVVNRLVDCGFLLDMFIQFFLAYSDLEGKTVIDHKRIAKRYLQSWFGVDFVSILPYDMLGMLFNSADLSQLKLLRIVRLLRLLKLLRLIKAARILKRYESQLGVSFAMLALLKFMVVLITVAHWSACLWYITGAVSETKGWDCVTSLDQCGIGLYKECKIEPDPDGETDGECELKGQKTSWILQAHLTTVPVVSKFVHAIYFGIYLIFSGAPPAEMGPTTDGERVVMMVLMAFAGMVYAYIIGSVCNIVSNMDLATKLYEQSMDHLNAYMTEVRLPQALRVEMRLFFMQAKAVHRATFYQDTLKMMSPKLRKDIALYCHKAWMGEIHFFSCPASELEESAFQAAIALALSTQIFAPTEHLISEGEFCENFFVVQKGIVARLGRVLGKNRFVGEDVILHNTRRPYSVRTLTFVICEKLTKDDLEKVANKQEFPLVRFIIRRCAIKLSIVRFFVNMGHNPTESEKFVKKMHAKIKLLETNAANEFQQAVSRARSNSVQSDTSQAEFGGPALAALEARLGGRMEALEKGLQQVLQALNGRQGGSPNESMQTKKLPAIVEA